MAFEIRVTSDAEQHMAGFTPRERNTLRTALGDRLRHQPTQPTRAIKRLRPDPTALYELRVGDLRDLYDVVNDQVFVRAIGRKVGNELWVNGEAFDGLRDDSPKSPGGQPSDDA